MGIFCSKQSQGCWQDSVTFMSMKIDMLNLELELPDGFRKMEKERQNRFYPRTGQPDVILENDSGIQITGQATRQKIKAGEIWDAAQAVRELTAKMFPRYSVSQVYLYKEGWLPVGWFRMEMTDKQAEHIKVLSVTKGQMVIVTFTYPATEAMKWRSVLRHSFGTWRECHEEN